MTQCKVIKIDIRHEFSGNFRLYFHGNCYSDKRNINHFDANASTQFFDSLLQL